jgi:alpha-galactosidase
MRELHPHYCTRRILIASTAALIVAGESARHSAIAKEGNRRIKPGEIPEIASGDPETPEFHGPRVIGATPGRDFLFQVPHTGVAPVVISAGGLPAGLRMTEAGRITGKIENSGTYNVRLTASNRAGNARRMLRIVAGQHKLALTPPMGWNSWYAYSTGNTADLTRAAADAIVKTGLAAKGFMYVNLDDGWQGGRNGVGSIMPTAKFGDMQKLIAHVHQLGLRFGIYSSPGPKTCAGHTGSWGHELRDAQTYARWGVDFLKYDWCSYSKEVPRHPSLEQYIKPYAVMRRALDSVDRDIFFSLCQYGMAHVWTWGGQVPVFGNQWRTSGDIIDTWHAISRNGFDCERQLFPFAGPGHWNDPCMLMLGYGKYWSGSLRPTRLTPHEQLLQVTLWSMLSAPLVLSCDLDKLDRFTIDLVTNTEVVAVDQDALGMQGQCVDRQAGGIEIWARPLWDGTVAVALFNRGPKTQTGHIASWDMLDPVLPRGARTLRGAQKVRDLWKRKTLGMLRRISTPVTSHSAVMLKIGTPSNLSE